MEVEGRVRQSSGDGWGGKYLLFVDEDTVATFEDDKESVADPNEASVTKMSFEPGIRAVPNSTAVPAGEERVSWVETVPLRTGKTDKNPVLLTAGLPLTVVSRAVSFSLKKVCDTVLVGPTGGVVWLTLKGRSSVSRGVRPLVLHIDKQATPALAPEFATHAREREDESATLIGNSPSVEAGWPIMVSCVGSVGEMANIETVFEPGFTATRFWFC